MPVRGRGSIMLLCSNDEIIDGREFGSERIFLEKRKKCFLGRWAEFGFEVRKSARDWSVVDI